VACDQDLIKKKKKEKEKIPKTTKEKRQITPREATIHLTADLVGQNSVA
jgi:hypothetical protein